MRKEFVLPRGSGAKRKRGWTPEAAKLVEEKYERYARERRVEELADILEKRFGQRWSADAICKKAKRIGVR